MPNEVKQRKKPQSKPSDDTSETTAANCQEDDNQKLKTKNVSNCGEKASSCLDLKSILCLLSLAACGALSWVVLRQNERFSEMEEQFRLLNGKASSLFDMEQEITQVSKKCERVKLMLESLAAQSGDVKLKDLEQDVGRLKQWASGLKEKRDQLQTSLATLRDAVAQIQDRTNTISKDFTSKVASVRTDVRRMDGLRSELESLLSQVGELEDKTSQVEHTMVRRIGDVLASSIDRVSSLSASTERNSQGIDQLQRKIPELVNADKKLSERLMELESGRAKVIRTVTFASDLKSKVFTIKRDFGALEPQLSDLTLRIGRLAEDLSKREQEIIELKQTLVNLTSVESDLGHTSKQVSEIIDASDIEKIDQPT